MSSVLPLLDSTLWPHALRFCVGGIADAWQTALRRFRDPYRPELHYMRGPGPKCREKQLIAQVEGRAPVGTRDVSARSD